MYNIDEYQKQISQYQTVIRLQKEFILCSNDIDLKQIITNIKLENENLFKWKLIMKGGRDTPYEGGLFTISLEFPNDYPKHGPEFKFLNKIYHLNVDNQYDIGHISLSRLNEWKGTGKVREMPIYTVKQALFDIFWLFYNQGTDSPYDEERCILYRDNPVKFNEEVKKWTQKYAIDNES